jgi:hypothetical protein
MRRSRLPNSTRMIAGLLTSLLFAILTLPLTAQSTPESSSTRPMSFGYDKAHEITLNGTIQEVVTQRRESGSPAGLHLLVVGSRGVVDAHLGPFLTKDVQEALHAGTPIQIVGAMQAFQGKNYLLARQVIFGGRLVTVRSENGFLVLVHATRGARSKPENTSQNASQVEINGGAR